MNKWKLYTIALIWAAGLFDVITFLITSETRTFEINTVILLTRSVALVLFMKISVLVVVSYMIAKYVPKKSYLFSYWLAYISIVLIIIQTAGGISNLYVEHEYSTKGPGLVKPMEKVQALETNLQMTLYLGYIPIVLALLSFALFERMYGIRPSNIRRHVIYLSKL